MLWTRSKALLDVVPFLDHGLSSDSLYLGDYFERILIITMFPYYAEFKRPNVFLLDLAKQQQKVLL